ncbi:MAG: DUF6457 domain-containing protein [Actinomycetota bacterium]
MIQLDDWFRMLDEHLQVPPDRPLGPAPGDVKVLLDLGKVAAEAGPQRYFALLTAFAVGRALGRAESEVEVEAHSFLERALEAVRLVSGKGAEDRGG